MFMQRGVVQCFILALRGSFLQRKMREVGVYLNNVYVNKVECASVHIVMVCLYRNCYTLVVLRYEESFRKNKWNQFW